MWQVALDELSLQIQCTDTLSPPCWKGIDSSATRPVRPQCCVVFTSLYPVPLGTYYSLLRKIIPHVFLMVPATLGIGTFRVRVWDRERECPSEGLLHHFLPSFFWPLLRGFIPSTPGSFIPVLPHYYKTIKLHLPLKSLQKPSTKYKAMK